MRSYALIDVSKVNLRIYLKRNLVQQANLLTN